MTKLTPLSLITAAIILFSGHVLSQDSEAVDSAACEMPGAPIIPDGNVASEDELVAAQKAMKVFQGSLLTFRDCIAKEEKEIDPESEEAPAMGQALLDQYNASVDAEENLAAEFNDAVKAFKARQ